MRSFFSGRSKIQKEKYTKWYEVNWAGRWWKKRKLWAKLQMVMDTNWLVILNNQSFAISKHDTFFLNLGFWFNWFVDMVFAEVYCLFMFTDKTVSDRAISISQNSRFCHCHWEKIIYHFLLKIHISNNC